MTKDPRTVRGEYLKRHTEALIKDIGYAKACEASGKSKATLGRYASAHDENSDRFIPVNVLIELEMEASIPFVTINNGMPIELNFNFNNVSLFGNL